MKLESIKKKLMGAILPFIILSLGCFVYYSVIYQFHWNAQKSISDYTILTISSILLFFVVWSYLSAMFVDPGKPPVFWGFFLENPEEKKRQYCPICHIYKPERCHHCSTCGKCVLNMDHHCPWLKNCVGFFNKKYFLLLLFYTWTTLLAGMINSLFPLIRMTKQLINEHKIAAPFNIINFTCLVLSFGMMFALFVILTSFIKYHVDLIQVNMTTIEKMKEARDGEVSEVSYDFGLDFNWTQIMGKKRYLWWIPYLRGIEGPNGDGVVFPKKVSKGEEPDYVELQNSLNQSAFSGNMSVNPLFEIAERQDKSQGLLSKKDTHYSYQDKSGSFLNTNNKGYNPLTSGYGKESKLNQGTFLGSKLPGVGRPRDPLNFNYR